MSETTKKNIMLRLLFIVGFVVILMVFLAWQKTRTSQAIVNGLREIANSENTTGSENIIANAWIWEAISDEQIINGVKHKDRNTSHESRIVDTSVHQIDVVLVYTALGSIELDEMGAIVVNQQTLRSLEALVATFDEEISAADIEGLKILVETGLPGKTGKQIAQFVTDFFLYRKDKITFERQRKIPSNIEDAGLQYEQLKAIREHHFGDEISNKLFGKQEELTRFTLDSFESQTNSELSEKIE